MIIRIRSLASDEVLAGAQEGKNLLARLVREVQEPTEPEVLFLDFDEIAVATGSFLREGPMAFRRILRSNRTTLYPVIANASRTVLDELELYLRSDNDALFACSLANGTHISNLRVVGKLDEKQALTLELLREYGDTTATALADTSRDPDVKATAWSNRLSALTLKGLAMEISSGRTKLFRLPVKES